jgi:hypothetical protein
VVHQINETGARRLPLCLSMLMRVLIVILVMIMIAPAVAAVAVPSACPVHPFVITAEECVAIVVAFRSGNWWTAILRIVVGIHLAMRAPIVSGGFDSIMEGAAAYIVVVVGRLNVPLNHLRMRVPGTAQRYPCQTNKK